MNDQPTSDRDELGAGSDSAEAKSARKQNSERSLVSPDLVTYFGARPVPAAAFVKAVRAAKILRFSEHDVRDASVLMSTNDIDAGRLSALAAQAKLPDAIDRWIWPAIQQRLKAEVPSIEQSGSDAAEILRLVHTHTASDLAAETDKSKRRRAESLLRVTLAWLITQRSLPLWPVVEQLSSKVYRDATASSRAVRRILTRGKMQQIKDACAVGGVAQGVVRTALLQHDQVERRQISLQNQLTVTQSENASLREEKTALQQEVSQLAEQLASAQSGLADSKQHWGHDMVDAKARQNALLNNRLLPLINDAIDALEIEPSQPQIALRRLKSAIQTINEASQ